MGCFQCLLSDNSFLFYVIPVCKMVVAERSGSGRRGEVKREGGKDEEKDGKKRQKNTFPNNIKILILEG